MVRFSNRMSSSIYLGVSLVLLLSLPCFYASGTAASSASDGKNGYHGSRRPPPPTYAVHPRKGAIDSTLYYPKDERCLLQAIKKYAVAEFVKDKPIAATMLRMAFHDCLTMGGGCDGSILKNREINDMNGTNSPLQATVPVLNRIRRKAAQECDVMPTIADSIARVGSACLSFFGLPDATNFGFRLGRRDVAPRAAGDDTRTLPNVLEPFSTALEKMTSFGLTLEEVTLYTIGGHTVGKSGCDNFLFRLNNSNDRSGRSQCAHPVDQTLDPKLACKLTKECRNGTVDVDVNFDTTPFKMDTVYFKMLLKNQGLLNTDQDFANDPRTAAFVRKYASGSSQDFQQDYLKVFVKAEMVNINGPTTQVPAKYYYDN